MAEIEQRPKRTVKACNKDYSALTKREDETGMCTFRFVCLILFDLEYNPVVVLVNKYSIGLSLHMLQLKFIIFIGTLCFESAMV